jgi:desumoylating isopeptidase 1
MRVFPRPCLSDPRTSFPETIYYLLANWVVVGIWTGRLTLHRLANSIETPNHKFGRHHPTSIDLLVVIFSVRSHPVAPSTTLSAMSSTSPSSSTSSNEVILAVYDLSRGMARSLSAQILGGPEYAIDMVPHTGLVVYGSEYFFGAGAGIQREDPGAFRRSRDMNPVQLVSLGRTRVAQADFERWCHDRTADGSYGGLSYDLLRRNCNNFSNDAARHGLQLNQGVPEWILQVPQKFLSSPMGMMMRPMLENMQLSGPSSDGASPFSARAQPPAAAASSMPSNTRNFHSSATTSSVASSTNNPWANLASSSTNASRSTVTTTTHEIGATDPATASSAVECPPVSPPKKPRPSHQDATSAPSTGTSGARFLETLSQPLVSSDASMVPLCLKKLKGALSDEEFKVLEAGVSPLPTSGATSSSPASAIVVANPNAVCQVLRRALEDRHHVSFVLLLLRVLVLHIPFEETSSECTGCLAWIQHELNKRRDAHDTGGASSNHSSAPALSPTARAAAWLTLSNAATVGWMEHLPRLGSTVDCALVDWNLHVQPKAEVRQAAAGFLYNVSPYLVRPNGNQHSEDSGSYNADDMVTSILCFGLEGLAEESDATCRLRRCMILGRLLLQQPLTTKALNSSSLKDAVEDVSGKDTRSEATPRYETTDDENWQLRRTLAVELGIKNVLTSLIATASAQRSREDSSALYKLAEELLSALV